MSTVFTPPEEGEVEIFSTAVRAVWHALIATTRMGGLEGRPLQNRSEKGPKKSPSHMILSEGDTDFSIQDLRILSGIECREAVGDRVSR